MTAINKDGQVYWTFDELDLYEEYKEVYKESCDLLSLSIKIRKNIIESFDVFEDFASTDEYKELSSKADELFSRSIKLLGISDLIYSLWEGLHE